MRQKEIDKLNRETETEWKSRFDHVPAKIGTVPMNVWIPNDTVLEVGKRLVFFEDMHGQRQTGIIDKLEPILFVTRM